ncbi:hypothetical protein ACP4OV_019668 [Aristida adscensionis]
MPRLPATAADLVTPGRICRPAPPRPRSGLSGLRWSVVARRSCSACGTATHGGAALAAVARASGLARRRARPNGTTSGGTRRIAVARHEQARAGASGRSGGTAVANTGGGGGARRCAATPPRSRRSSDPPRRGCARRQCASARTVLPPRRHAGAVLPARLRPPPQPHHRRQVFVVSDLHTDYPENMEWVRRLPTKVHARGRGYGEVAALVVTGDVVETRDNFARTMATLRERFAAVLYMPGSYIWLRREGRRYYGFVGELTTLLDACSELGVDTSPRMIGDLGNHTIVLMVPQVLTRRRMLAVSFFDKA